MPVTERDITEKLGSVPAVVAGLRKPAQCPMCGELFADPVVTRCGHCFCRDCVVGHPKAACPACDAPMAPVALKPSKKMQDIVEVIRQLLVSLSEESALASRSSGRTEPLEPAGPITSTPIPGRAKLTPEAKVRDWLATSDPEPVVVVAEVDEPLNSSGAGSARKFFKSRDSPPTATPPPPVFAGSDPFTLPVSPVGKAPDRSRGRGRGRGRGAKSATPTADAEPDAEGQTSSRRKSAGSKGESKNRGRGRSRARGARSATPTSAVGAEDFAPLDAVDERSAKSVTPTPAADVAEGDSSKKEKPGPVKKGTSSTKPIEDDPLDDAGSDDDSAVWRKEPAAAKRTYGQRTPVRSTMRRSSGFFATRSRRDAPSDAAADPKPPPPPPLSTSNVDVIDMEVDPLSPVEAAAAAVVVPGRRTFVVTSDTQDILELSAELRAGDYTQKQFAGQTATLPAAPPAALPAASAGGGGRRVSFERRGRLLPLKTPAAARSAVRFRLLGRLEPARTDVQVRLEPSERKRPSRHQATQTETAASSAPHSVGVQTEAAASDGVASQSDGAGESVVLNSVDFLQPTLPDVRLAVLRPAEDDGDNIIVESDSEVTDTGGSSIPSRQCKRVRRISSDAESDPSQAPVKRRRDAAAPSTPTPTAPPPPPPPTQPPPVPAAVQNSGAGSRAEPAPAQQVEPPETTVVVDSEPESEDLFRAEEQPAPAVVDGAGKTPDPAPAPTPARVFVCSGLSRPLIRQVDELCARLGAELVAAYEARVTHVIVRADPEDNSAERTLKFLYGVAGRKWIVSIEWVRQCLRQNAYVNEEPYEVLDMDGENGPWRARHCRRLLFAGYAFSCRRPFSDVSVEQLHEMLRLCGARTAATPAQLVAARDDVDVSCRLLVVQTDAEGATSGGGSQQVAAADADAAYQRHGVLTVSREWVLDCIASYFLYPIRSQLVGSRAAQLAAADQLGLPAEIL